MNASDENHEPTAVDELHDRLVDRALREVMGSDSPPDLSARILAADVDARPRVATPVTSSSRHRRLRWLTLAVAAVLLVGFSMLLLPPMTGVRETAQTSPAANNTKQLQLSETIDRSVMAERRGNDPAAHADPKRIKAEVNALETQLVTAKEVPADSAVPVATPAPASILSSGESSAAAKLPSPFYLADDVQYQYGNLDLGSQRLKNEAEDSLQWRYSSENTSAPVEYGEVTAGLVPAKSGPSVEALAMHDQRRWPANANNLGLDAETAEGTGPGLPGDQYTRINENPFIKAEGGAAVSTFSIDVDTASYANVRQFLMAMEQLPPPDAVRIEELINYFDYDYAGPKAEDEAPFASHVEVASCPWRSEHRLVRIGIKGRELKRDKRPKSNLVFLVDVSGSMDEPNKLPLVVYGLQQLTRELGENDRVAIVVYASSEGLVLPSTNGSNQAAILEALGKLSAGGSTAGGAGIQLAYQIAEDNFIEGGTNRVILCTDGDFNVGVTSTAELERLCEQKAKDTRVFLSVLGFGRGNLNDAMMEAISNRGNGNHHYVDNRTEARRVLVKEMTGTLITIAKDVKIQVEFNPLKVAGYRLIGYENRMLRTEDFNDDKKDAGEIGEGHTVTALYEVVPAGKKVDVEPVDDLKYQQQTTPETDAAKVSDELLTLKMRYKAPEGDTSKKLEWPITDDGQTFSAASEDFQFATAAAGFGLVLRDSQHKGNLTLAAVLELAQSAMGQDKDGYRAEFLEMVRKAKELRHE